MKTSVAIPTYNSAKTIEATLEAVFAQSIPPDEILIMDDGSTDNTVPLLGRYIPRITLIKQRNRGVAHARNVLSERARGDLIAFLDHDDIWHPDYLAVQQKSCEANPHAVAFFTRHVNFYGHGNYQWKNSPHPSPADVEVMAPLNFLERLHEACGQFASMSLCCVPKSVLLRLGREPFCPEVSGVDDFYLYHTLMLLGPVVFSSKPLVAYRITPGAQSASALKSVGKSVRALELLETRFNANAEFPLRRAFKAAFSSTRRGYGKALMGSGQPDQARKQLWISLTHCSNPISLAKSLVLLFLTGVPHRLQPRWPSEWKASHSLRS